MEIIFYIFIALILSVVVFLGARAINSGLKARNELKESGVLDSLKKNQYNYENKYPFESDEEEISTVDKNLSDQENQDKITEVDNIDRNQLILNQIPDLILVINKFKEVIYSNDSSMLRFGQDIEGRHLASVLRSPEILENVDLCIKEQKTKSLDIEIKHPTYQSFFVTIFLGPKSFLGRNETIIIVLKDSTEISKVQKLKSDFVANASHELRTPLQSIKLGLETINTGNAKDDPEAQKKFLNLMLDQAKRMETLIKDLLTLSKIEMEEHIRPNKAIILSTVVDEVISSLNAQIKKNKIKINNKIQDSIQIIGDKDKLIEIFTNLIENSIKYSEPEKTISITAKQNGDSVEIKLKDQGIGIPKIYINRVTERFFRVDPEKSKSVGGTGLGLSIVKHLINQHRGTFDIESEDGKGSEFIMTFPSA